MKKEIDTLTVLSSMSQILQFDIYERLIPDQYWSYKTGYMVDSLTHKMLGSKYHINQMNQTYSIEKDLSFITQLFSLYNNIYSSKHRILDTIQLPPYVFDKLSEMSGRHLLLNSLVGVYKSDKRIELIREGNARLFLDGIGWVGPNGFCQFTTMLIDLKENRILYFSNYSGYDDPVLGKNVLYPLRLNYKKLYYR